PSRSSPTRLATIPELPSSAVIYAKFAGAHPSCLPCGKRSQRSSPRPTTMGRGVDISERAASCAGKGLVEIERRLPEGGFYKDGVAKRDHGVSLGFSRDCSCSASLSS